MRTAVMLPTYNEAENLPAFVERLFAACPNGDVDLVVVDDASPDGTGEIADRIAAADPRVHVIHRAGPRGYAAASREGLRWCLDRGYDAIGSMDADLSHDPAVVPRLIARITDGADLAIGSRYVDGGSLVVHWGPVRRTVSKAGSAYAHLMIGTGVKDCTSGFRCYRASALAAVSFERITADGYSFLIELLALLADGGARVAEVPISYVDRRAGASKISRTIILEALWRTTALGLRRVFDPRRRSAR